jgi:hypothetical protein
MTSIRKRSSNPPQPQEWRQRGPQDTQAPRSGRTGRLGSRAERPSEGSERKGVSPTTEPDRSKPPSPNAGRRESAVAQAELPQPVRDSTA